MARKMKKACRTRWLSLDNSVSSVYEDIEPLLKTVNNFNTDPIAIGLLKKTKNTKFIGAIYILKWVLLIAASTTEQDISTRIVKFFARRSCNSLYQSEIAGNIRTKGAIRTIKNRFTL